MTRKIEQIKHTIQLTGIIRDNGYNLEQGDETTKIFTLSCYHPKVSTDIND